MITFATKESTPLIRSMWKECFDDTDEYIKLFFTEKYEELNTLIYWIDDAPAASLQMLPYTIRFYRKLMPCYYLAGLCTLPKYRNMGYMGKLINKSFEVMKERKIPISILIPAEEWLYDYYNKFGFEEIFKKGDKPIRLNSILKNRENLFFDAYKMFDLKYQQSDFYILKSYKDFTTIVKDFIADGCPDKYNLRGMSTIIDPLTTLNAYAQSKHEVKFSVRIKDMHNNQISFLIENGMAKPIPEDKLDNLTFDINTNILTRLLFGYKIKDIGSPFESFFDEHKPQMNLMLE